MPKRVSSTAPRGAAASPPPPAVSLRGISKSFPGVKANENINLEIARGEIHALLGENGAGKTTLMNIIAGLYRPDSGVLRIGGRAVQLRNPRDAARLGIGMVHQHFTLVPSFTVAENILLGLPKPRWLLHARRFERALGELAHRYGMQVEPAAPVWQLSVGEQQRVEILKLLYRGAQILILDEPTAVLTPQETDSLFSTLRELAAAGRTILFISHKLNEVMQLAHRISVLRKGRVSASGLPAAGQTLSTLTQLMVGREIPSVASFPRGAPGAEVLAVKGLTARGDRRELKLRGLDLAVRRGEIVGLAGVAGNGQQELVEVLTGRRRAEAGTATLDGRDLLRLSTRQIMALGMSCIPAERRGVGSASHLSVLDNSILTTFRAPPFCRFGLLNRKQIRLHARRLIEQFAISVPGADTQAALLSGGNLQKLILAREFAKNPAVLIAVHPTRGLDVGAAAKTHEELIRQRSRDTGILLLSEDLEELIAISDRIAVIYGGRNVGEIAADRADLKSIGLLMMGAVP